MKRIGIIGIDRSGSKTNFPIVVVSVYSDKIGNFDKTVGEVRDAIKHEVSRGKDFRDSDYKRAMDIITKNNIQFLAYIIDRKIFNEIKQKIRKKQNWLMVSEAYLWYKSISLLLRKIKQTPTEIIYERTYTGSGTDAFDIVFKELLNKNLGIGKQSITIGEKTSPYIMIADWIGHFFYSSPKLTEEFKDYTIFSKMEFIERDLERLFGYKKQSAPHTHVVHDTAANLRMSGTINKMVEDIFKAYGFYQTSDQPLFITTSRKTLSSIPLKVTADENEVITKLTFNQSFSSNTNLTLAYGYLGTVNTGSDAG